MAAFGLLMLVPAPWFGLALMGLIGGSALVRMARRRPARVVEGGAVALGRDALGRTVALTDGQLAAHGIVLGASGAGKSTTLVRILSDRIQRGLPVVAIDLKGSPAFTGALAAASRRVGRPCLVWSLDGTTHWNPLAHGSPTELKDKLIATERFTEPHYRRAAERYLQTALTVLIADRTSAHPVGGGGPVRAAPSGRGRAPGRPDPCANG